jgi:hypothetical protein
MTAKTEEGRKAILQLRLNGLLIDVDTIIEHLNKPTDPVVLKRDAIHAILLLTTAAVILAEIHLYSRGGP